MEDKIRDIATPEFVLNSILKCSGYTLEDLKSKNRKRNLVMAKHMFLYLGYVIPIRHGLKYTETYVSGLIGNNHTMVWHALKKYSDERFFTEKEKVFYDKVIEYLNDNEELKRYYEKLVQTKLQEIEEIKIKLQNLNSRI